MKNRFLIILAFVFIFAISGVGLGMTGVSLASHKKADEIEQDISVATLTSAENKTVQTKLKRWGYYKGAIDGIYGNQTKTAVKNFQRKNGLHGLIYLNVLSAVGGTVLEGLGDVTL